MLDSGGRPASFVGEDEDGDAYEDEDADEDEDEDEDEDGNEDVGEDVGEDGDELQTTGGRHD